MKTSQGKGPKIPKGWRKLKIGERILRKDRFWNPSTREWLVSNMCGDMVGDPATVPPYIRRVRKKGRK